MKTEGMKTEDQHSTEFVSFMAGTFLAHFDAKMAARHLMSDKASGAVDDVDSDLVNSKRFVFGHFILLLSAYSFLALLAVPFLGLIIFLSEGGRLYLLCASLLGLSVAMIFNFVGLIWVSLAESKYIYIEIGKQQARSARRSNAIYKRIQIFEERLQEYMVSVSEEKKGSDARQVKKRRPTTR